MLEYVEAASSFVVMKSESLVHGGIAGAHRNGPVHHDAGKKAGEENGNREH